MGKIIFVSCFTSLILSLTQLFGNDTTVINLRLQKQISGNFSDYTVDNLGNIYLVNNQNQIKKLNSNFDSVGIYNDVKHYGIIESMDASNPMRILVYYKNAGTILVLDRFLNARNTIDLRKQNLLLVKTIAQSYDNQIWLFDEWSFTIKKIDDYGNITVETPDFRLLFNDEQSPLKLLDNGGWLYTYHPKNGWKVFDYYGAFKQQFSELQNWQDVQVNDGTLLGRDAQFLWQSVPQKLILQAQKCQLPLANYRKIIQSSNMIYALNNQGLEIYQR